MKIESLKSELPSIKPMLTIQEYRMMAVNIPEQKRNALLIK
ncbi:hypothetical protein [Vibrio brasiliensis]|nr:hypothetical protein [Vibrio brasiliensis]